jgi:hypothetical protein
VSTWHPVTAIHLSELDGIPPTINQCLWKPENKTDDHALVYHRAIAFFAKPLNLDGLTNAKLGSCQRCRRLTELFEPANWLRALIFVHDRCAS